MDLKKPCPPWIWLLPLSLDFASTASLNASTMLTQASTVQMLRTFNIIIVFLLSAFYLKNRIFLHQLIGVCLILAGVSLVGTYAIKNPDTETNYEDRYRWLGIFTAVMGTTLSALQWVVEESIFRRFTASPVKGVGWMGLFGIFVAGAALLICQFSHLEDVRGTLFQLGNLNDPLYGHIAKNLIGLNCAYTVSLSINTASGITVTRLASSLLRTMINAIRTISVWLIELRLGWSSPALLNFLGLVVTIAATGVYNLNYCSCERRRGSCGTGQSPPDSSRLLPGPVARCCRAFAFANKACRKPVACFPNKHEVTLTAEVETLSAKQRLNTITTREEHRSQSTPIVESSTQQQHEEETEQ